MSCQIDKATAEAWINSNQEKRSCGRDRFMIQERRSTEGGYGVWDLTEQCWVYVELKQIEMLGYIFHRMDEQDYDAYAGAADGAFISYTHAGILILDPKEKTLTEITESMERTWRFVSSN